MVVLDTKVFAGPVWFVSCFSPTENLLLFFFLLLQRVHIPELPSMSLLVMRGGDLFLTQRLSSAVELYGSFRR